MRSATVTILAILMGTSIRADELDVAEVTRGNTQFALDLYGKLRQESGNLFLSPYSLSSALAMTYAGARGETAQQMAAALHLSLPQDRLHRSFGSLRERLNSGGPKRGYQLSVANRLWGQRGYHFLPDFLTITRESYGAGLAELDFALAEPSRQLINAWASQETRGKIDDLMPPGVLNAQTRLVLTNAVYFKGDWTVPFDKRATKEAPFHVTAADSVAVPMMHRRGRLRFFAGDGMQALSLPYGEGDLAMVVLLPEKLEGLPDLEAGLTDEKLSECLAGMREQEVVVDLPRFKMTSQFSLAEPLKAMGMTRAFDPDQADFSGMSTQEQLSISGVIHKAFVDVNEEGTEAAAATGIAVGTTAFVPREPAVFRADHPFLFLIRDTKTGSILFLGRVVNPRG